MEYQCLNRQIFEKEAFKILPIRTEDKYLIMQWRNEQMFHLRQNKPLTIKDQDSYFKNIVSKLFLNPKPDQLLFSFFYKNIFVGYGGLVHINWVDKNAEISFLINTDLEKEYFEYYWINFLELIEQVGFEECDFHKIYTYAFDLRQNLYTALLKSNFNEEARLKDHCYFNVAFKDVVIHSKVNSKISLRIADIKDLHITYAWATNEDVRKFSFSKAKINIEEHQIWFQNKLTDTNCVYFIAEKDDCPIGSIRFDIKEKDAIISYLLSPDFHGKGYGKTLLFLGVKELLNIITNIDFVIGYVMSENIPSVKAFERLGYQKELRQDDIKFSLKINNNNANRNI